VVRPWIEARNYWVITVRPDGRPHAAPVWGIWWGGTLWFGTGPESVKGRNLAADPRIAVHLESGDEVAVLEGTAAPVAVPEDAAAAFADAYEQKYEVRPDVADGFYRVQPVTLLTWTETIYPHGKFRWRW
jgi:PPOX class probable F420-dependent enzyme